MTIFFAAIMSLLLKVRNNNITMHYDGCVTIIKAKTFALFNSVYSLNLIIIVAVLEVFVFKLLIHQIV